MRKFFLSAVLLLELLLAGLPGAGILTAGAISSGTQPGALSEAPYHNPPNGNTSAPQGPQVAQLQTVPAVPGVTIQIAGQQFVTGADGSAVIMVPAPGTYDLQVITDTYHDPYRRVEFSRWLSESFQPTRTIHLPTKSPVVQVGLDVYMLVGQKFLAPDGSPVDPQRITQFSIRSIQGDNFTFKDGTPRWIPASRVTRRRSGGLEPVDLLYTVTSVMVDGSNVVNKAQQQFFAKPNDIWHISLLFYSMQVHSKDALFGFPVGTDLRLELPNGQIQIYPLDSSGAAEVHSLARGQYYFQIAGAKGISPRAPVTLSKDQDLSTRVITYLDMGTVFGTGLFLAIGLLVFGRFSLKQAEARNDRARRVRILPTDDLGREHS
jgi:hypothetical protein